jgi:hypothetical protein
MGNLSRVVPRLVVAVLAVVVPLLSAASPAAADPAGDILATVNSMRAAHGLAALTVDPTLASMAQQWSQRMSAAQALAEPPLNQIPAGWTAVGSNIGSAGTVAILFSVSWNDPGHIGNMVKPVFNRTGIGVVTDAHGKLWATELFEARAGVSPPPPTTPRTTAAPTTVPHSSVPTVPGATTTAPATLPGPTTTAVDVTTTVAPPLPPVSSPAASLTVDKPSVEPGKALVVTGVGCDPGAAVVLTMGGHPPVSTVSDGDGHFSAPFLVGGATPGSHRLTAACGPTLTADFVVVAARRPAGGSTSSPLLLVGGAGIVLAAIGGLIWFGAHRGGT